MYELIKQNTEIWDLFTAKEEYFPKQLDKHGRFAYAFSTHKNILEPTVSKYLTFNGMDVEYPNNKKFAVCLTHDIDDIYPVLKHTLLSSAYCLKNLSYSDFKKQTFWLFNDKYTSPYINFREIIELEKKYDAKSSFYFIATDKDPNRFRYDLEDIEDELRLISDSGWEIGLHGGYYSFDNFDEIIKEKSRLEAVIGQEVIGFRNHYLRFMVPDSWEFLSKAGFKYDTTFGYSDMVGFRNGMCHPFRPYNLNKKREINILEIPLVVMDATVFNITTSFEEAWKYTKDLIDIVEKYNGTITFLWHNNNILNCPYRMHWSKLYEKILKYCYEKNAWMTSGEEIYKWWENRH